MHKYVHWEQKRALASKKSVVDYWRSRGQS